MTVTSDLECSEHRATEPTAYDIPVVFLRVTGLVQTRDPAMLDRACTAWVTEVPTSDVLEAFLAAPRFAGYRELHRRIGKTGRNFVPSPESQLRILCKRRAWRAINPLVDCYNLLALQSGVSIGAHDVAHLELPVRLAVADGGESVLLLGDIAPQRLSAGEYVYLDAQGRTLGRLECRQAAHSQVCADTSDCLFILQGHDTLPASELRDTAYTLLAALARFIGEWARAEMTLSHAV